MVAVAREALRDRRAGKALVALRAAPERSPNDPGVRTELAHAHTANRWIAQARREIEAALDAGADDGKAHYVGGVVCLWTEEREEAERHARRAVALDPANAAARAARERLLGQ